MSVARARLHRAAKGRALDLLGSGALSLRETVREPPKALLHTSLWAVLLRAPGVGPETARRVCERAQVWPLSTLEELIPGERRAVIYQLPERVK